MKAPDPRGGIGRVRATVATSLLLLVGAGLGLPFAVGAAAQQPVVEEQVALDAEGRLLRVDVELARTLGVFGDLTNVREILLFRGAGGYTLEVTRSRGGVLVRERHPLTEAEVAALRADITARLAARAPTALLDRSGRTLLLATSTAAGLGFYGWAVPYALDVEDTKGQVALYMLVGSASFFGPWLWSSGRPVSLGMANGAFWGASRGIVHGIGVHHVLAGDEPLVQCFPDDFTCYERAQDEQDAWRRARIATALGMSVAEGIGALAWAKAANATPGDAHLVGIASDLGAAGAVGVGVLAAGEDLSTRAAWGLSLAGAAAGIGGGVLLRARRDYAWGDAEVFRTAALLGAYTGGVAADVAGADRGRPLAALLLGGGAGGVILGDRLVRSRDIGAGQALLVDLGTIAGGLLGAGIAVLLSDEASGATLHLVLSAAGAWAGFGATYASLPDRVPAAPAPGAGERAQGSRLRGSAGRGGRDQASGPPVLRLDLVPFPDAGRGGSSLPPLAVRLRYRF